MIDLRFINVAADDTYCMAAAKAIRNLFAAECPLLTQSGRLLGLTKMECAPFTYEMEGSDVDGIALQKCLEDRDENNRTRRFGRCAWTCVDVGQRGVYAPQASHEGCRCYTATDCLHRRRLRARSARLPSRDGLHAGRNTNRF